MALFLDPNIALMRGIPTKVVHAATAAGTGFSNAFSIIKNPMADGGEITLQSANGTFTVFNGKIQMSLDGGTTWADFLNFDFVIAAFVTFDAIAGALYVIDILNIVETVACDILAVLG